MRFIKRGSGDHVHIIINNKRIKPDDTFWTRQEVRDMLNNGTLIYNKTLEAYMVVKQ